MKQNLLILNASLSGSNRFLFESLKKRGWNLIVKDVPIPARYKLWSLLKTFNFNKSKWGNAYRDYLGRYTITPSVFRERSRICERYLASHSHEYDLILQIGSLFAPSLKSINKKYVIFSDYTTRLAEKHFPEWAPLSSKRQSDELLELQKGLYQRAAMVFTTSNNTRRSMISDYGVREERSMTVGYGLPFSVFPHAEKKQYDRKTILFIGNNFKRKGGFTLLEAFKNVRNKIKDVRLIIIGPNQVLAEVEGVEWKGHIKDRDMIGDFLNKSSIFAMPSFCEPFGLVFLEAMSYRLPCIGSRVDAMPEIVEEGKTGFLVNAGDADDLGRKITLLLEDKKLMETMGEAGAKRVKERFTWDKVAEKIMEAKYV
ncbi:MAG: glycosyltransferase family 4 protein [Candidatus Gorgyraea atricola]|nr:glycosyltransferase family 4 protein [Candidatus Gorgyraea atricola]